ncbi:MAG: multicopper oxidase family protein [Deltaproteobacteria bacterium]|nr:multicopper oxidase family protein [Deltaproteobacteria bacterium]
MRALLGMGHAHIGLWALILAGCTGRVEYAKGEAGAEGAEEGGAVAEGGAEGSADGGGSTDGAGSGADGDPSDGGGDGGAVETPALRRPPEAPDLDPAPGVVEVELVAAHQTRTVADGRGGEIVVEGYAYNGSSPGPTIRAQVGDTVRVRLRNELEVPTTIHWHGLDVPFEMDGVVHGPGGGAPMAGAVEPGATFTYSFTVDRPLTAWYHPHFDSARQVDAGLYGALVVVDPSEPAVEQDLVLVLDDLPLDGIVVDEGGVDTGGHGTGGGHSGPSEGLWLVNGDVAPRLEVPAGLRLRLRLINVSNSGMLWIGADDEAPLRVIARDQGLLSAIEAPTRELLAPGDRVELEVEPSASPLRLIDHPYVIEGGEATGAAAPVLEILARGAGVPADPLRWPTSGAAPTTDPGSTDVRWLLQGSLSGDDWRINGEVFPEVTVAEAVVDQPVVIEVQNLSPTTHPFHLHGMAFEVLSIDGAAPAARQVEDTLNLGLYQRARLRAVPPAVGDWMAHCHILPHADGGMMTVLRVEEAE